MTYTREAYHLHTYYDLPKVQGSVRILSMRHHQNKIQACLLAFRDGSEVGVL